MNNPMQHSGDENGSSEGSNDPDQTSGGLMSASESGSELQHSGDENSSAERYDQRSSFPMFELRPRPQPKSQPSQPSSSIATESGCPDSNFRVKKFVFEAQIRPGDVEDERLTLLLTLSENFFEEAVTRWGQQLQLFCKCHDKNWPMKFKDPPVECGRLGIIEFKPFVAAHGLRPLDILCFHEVAQPLHVNHYFVHSVDSVERDDEDNKKWLERMRWRKQFKKW